MSAHATIPYTPVFTGKRKNDLDAILLRYPNKMAALLKTSRTQVDRLLDPKNDITLSSLQRAAAMVGRRVMIKLV